MNIVITGATKGIGRAIANKFASNGHNLYVCSRNKEDLDLMQTAYKREYPNIQLFTTVADISKKLEVEEFAKNVIKEMGNIDVLINNGGVFYPGMTTEEQDGTLEKMIETNLYSAYHLTRSLLPNIKTGHKRHIFNMCSIASKIAYPNGGSYSISKFALLGFTKVLREELKETGIKVTAILPGATWSDSWSGVDLPHERLMEAEDIADSVWSAYNLGPSAVVEEIIIRPQLGDL